MRSHFSADGTTIIVGLYAVNSGEALKHGWMEDGLALHFE
jgi:hypothetical protein